MAGNLTDKNHHEMDRFLGQTFDAIRDGKLDRASFIGGMAHVMAALDIDNFGEAVSWFKAGTKHFTLGESSLDGSDKLN